MVYVTPLLFCIMLQVLPSIRFVCHLKLTASIIQFVRRTYALRLCYCNLSLVNPCSGQKLEFSASERVCIKSVRAKPLYATCDLLQARAVVVTEEYVCVDDVSQCQARAWYISTFVCTPDTMHSRDQERHPYSSVNCVCSCGTANYFQYRMCASR